MQVHTLLWTVTCIFLTWSASSQNVGIGTTNPDKLLSVAGSIAVDHNNQNTGSVDRHALVFGTTPSITGISSDKSPGNPASGGLEFWTNGVSRLKILEEGTVGIKSSNPDPFYDLFVGGSIRSYDLSSSSLVVDVNGHFGGDAFVGSQLNINGLEYNNLHRLTVNGGHSYFGGEGRFAESVYMYEDLNVTGPLDVNGNIFCLSEILGPNIRAMEHMGVGGAPDPTYRLRVWDGNSRFGGDVQVTGELDAGEIITDEITTDQINGKGVVRSNGSSSLRLGFDHCWINTSLNGGSQTDITADITEFTGGEDNVRVFVSQFDPDPLPQYVNWHDFSFHIHSVDPVTDTCKVRVTNTTDANLSIKGMLYLTSSAKD